MTPIPLMLNESFWSILKRLWSLSPGFVIFAVIFTIVCVWWLIAYCISLKWDIKEGRYGAWIW